MTSDEKRFRALCRRASREMDRQKLCALVEEIIQMIDARQDNRFNQRRGKIDLRQPFPFSTPRGTY
jgi:hypothetical protein